MSLTIRSKRNIEIINPKLYNHDPVSGNRLYSITILINTIRTLADTKIFSWIHAKREQRIVSGSKCQIIIKGRVFYLAKLQLGGDFSTDN